MLICTSVPHFTDISHWTRHPLYADTLRLKFCSRERDCSIQNSGASTPLSFASTQVLSKWQLTIVDHIEPVVDFPMGRIPDALGTSLGAGGADTNTVCKYLGGAAAASLACFSAKKLVSLSDSGFLVSSTHIRRILQLRSMVYL